MTEASPLQKVSESFYWAEFQLLNMEEVGLKNRNMTSLGQILTTLCCK